MMEPEEFENVCRLVVCSWESAIVRSIDTNFTDFANQCPGASVMLPACSHPWDVLRMLRAYEDSSR